MSTAVIKLPIMCGERMGDVLSMPCGPHNTFGDIHTFLQHKLGNTDISVYLQDRGEHKFKYSHISHQTLQEWLYYGLPIPVSFHEPGKGFPVYVKTMSGKTFTITIMNDYSAKDVKERIYEKEEIPIDMQRVIWQGRRLEDDRKIEEYQIGPYSKLHVILNLRGGGFLSDSFTLVDITNDKGRVDHAWSKSAPRWRQVDNGFCIEGICHNIECDAYKHNVISSLRFGCFSMTSVIPKCPICNCMIDCDNIAFNNCFYKLRGVKQVANNPVSMPWVSTRGCYRTWDKDEAGVVEWEHMEIIVRKLDAGMLVPGILPCKEAPVAEKCAVCFNHLASLGDAVMLACYHSYHKWCWEAWNAALRSKGCEITCPLCRVVVEEV